MLPSGFRSKYEERVAANMTAASIAFTYEPICLKYDLPVKGAKCKVCAAPAVSRTAHYTPDFRFKSNGTYVETKGKFTSSNRTRLMAFKASRPDVTVRILFQCDNYLTKKHKKRYTEWAAANGYESAVGEHVPEGWSK